MSIPSKQIDGDVAVGRNVTAGGNAAVRGSAVVGHDLRVEGWLDAPNIKGPNKGLFKTAALLAEAYPYPRQGWWALVGEHQSTAEDAHTYLGQVYMADKGRWVAQTNADGTPLLGGNPSLSGDTLTADVERLQDDVEGLTSEVESVKARTTNNEEDITSLQEGQTTLSENLANAKIKSVGITILDGSAVLTVQTAEKIYSCTIPEATVSDAGLMSAVDKAKLATAYNVANAANDKATANETAINTLLGNNATDAIESFNEVIAFLAGIKDDESLVALLAGLKTADDTNAATIETVRGDTEYAQECVDELTETVHSEQERLTKLQHDTAIFPFDGTVAATSDLGSRPQGTIWFDSSKGYFAKVTEGSPSYGLPHNILGHGGAPTGARTDAIYRCGNVLYTLNGICLTELESSTLRAYVDSVKNKAKNDLFDLEERLPVFRFDGMLGSVADLAGTDIDSIWFITEERCFYTDDGSGYSPFLPHNDSYYNWQIAREDAIFCCACDLYIFDGETLAGWEPWQLRDDVDDLASEMGDMRSTADADREQTRRDFIGVWDEIGNIKNMIAAIASNEVHGLLQQLGYGQEDIADYIYLNLHGYCEVTMDELRLSAWRWTHRDELEGRPVLYVLPNLKEEWKEPGFDVDNLCRVNEVKYVNYVWARNGVRGTLWFSSECIINRFEVANLDENGELLIGEDAQLLSRPGGFINHLSGNIGYAYMPDVSVPGVRQFNTSQDSVTLYQGIFANQEIDAQNTTSDIDKITKIGSYAFHRCTLRNFNVGEWDCSGAVNALFGSRIVDSHLIFDFDPSGTGRPNSFDLLNEARIDNSTIEVNNLSDKGNPRPYFFNTFGHVRNVGQKHTVSVFASNSLRFPYLPGLVSVYGAAAILDMPNLEYIYANDGQKFTVSGDPIVADDAWGTLYYRRVFLRNIGAVNNLSSIWAYQMFDITRDPETTQENIDLFMECGRTWADRKALGYLSASIFISKKLMDILTPEQKSMFTSKGYTLVVILKH